MVICTLKRGLLGTVGASLLCASLAGCASTGPASPSLTALPAKGKPYERFQAEDNYCQNQAQYATGDQSPGQASNDSTVAGAVVGTALGAVAGAAIGSASGHAGAGAAIGAGTGLLAGTAIGSENGRASGGNVQARYDRVYAQCMSAKGNEIVEPPHTTYVVQEPVYVERPYYGYGYGYGYGYRRRYY